MERGKEGGMTKLKIGRSRKAITAAVVSLGVWAPALAQDAPAEVELLPRGHGWLLTDAEGLSLYTYTVDQEPGKSLCNAQCVVTWPPLAAPEDAEDWDEWSNCSKECDVGTRNRTRGFIPALYGGEGCNGTDSETEDCNTDPCSGM